MRPGGRPLFDLNELPEEDDEVSSVISNRENNVQATAGDSAVVADVAMWQHSPSAGAVNPAGQVKQEPNASVSGPAMFKNLASGSVILHPGQHPLSCFKPFSGFQPSSKPSSDDGSSGKDPVSKLIALPSALDSCRPRVVPVIRVVKSPNIAVEKEEGEIAGIVKDLGDNKDTTKAAVKKEMPNLNLDAEDCSALTKGSSSSDDRVEPVESLPLPSDIAKSSLVNATPAESIVDGSLVNPASQTLPPQLQSSECKSSIAGKRRSDEKDVMLGKKRNRQTVFLDMHEVKNVVGPPKPPAPRRSSASLPRLAKQNTSEKLPGEFNSQEEKKEPSPPPLSGRSQQTPDGTKPNHTNNNNKKGMPSVLDAPLDGGLPLNNSMKQTSAEDKQRQYAKPLGRKPHMPPAVAPLIADERPAGSSHRSLVKKGMPNNNNYRKPQVSSGASYPSLDTSVERMHREATCDRLWQVPGEAELRRVPGSFESVEEYVRVFEPLLFEECRAQLHNTWEELCESVNKDAHMPVSIKVVERRERGWYDAVLIPLDPQAKLNFKEGDAAVLSSPKPGSAGGRIKRAVNGNTPENAADSDIAGKVAGIVRRYFPLDTRDQKGAILHFHRGESMADMTEKIFEKFQIKSVVWYLTVLGSIATTQREYIALHSFRRLNTRMINAILEPKPELFPSNKEGSQPPATPECFTAAFSDHLHRTFNGPQLISIKWAAVHTADETNSSGSGRRREPWSFTLVQGPPGTGKTHTVWGMLNVIHLVQYQRYYAALLRKLAPGCLDSGADDNTGRFSSSSGSTVIEGSGSIDEVLQKMDESLARVLPKLCPKPRMLVCAPSNAATDELLTRVLERGFIDGEMKVYRPDVARVGIDTQSRAAQAVSVERRSDQLLGMGREAVVNWLQQLRVREASLSQRITGLQRELSAAAAATRSQGTLGVDPDVLAARDQSRDSRLQELAQAVEERDKVLVEMSRLLIVESQFHHSRGFSLENARAKLETSFAKEAEIVFTTVSSSGRRIFSNLAHGFDMVVIDEAAQASEVAVLPPLILGAARCVLVGDPQQLPATVISRAANTLQYSRSLFERFQQAGCPTLLLSVQYRMHPHIRDFPSRYFYQNCLADSDAIKALPDEMYHKDPLLRPYLFYDISHGRESHRGGSVSYQNVLEAQFAVRLYDYLQNNLKAAGLPKVSVGVITPYKLQLKCLQQEFEPVLNSEVDSKGVYINTVDAFQGQERDVIIMSCVRASNHGVGFVSDIRRMNVALTRARRCLWVMGNATALAQSEAWADLIADAKDRNCFVSMENAAVKTLMNTKLPSMAPLAGRSPGILRLPRSQGFSRSEFQSNSPSDGFTPQSRGRGGHDKQQQMQQQQQQTQQQTQQQQQQTQQAVAAKPQTEDPKTEKK